jgi:RNA polymerase sigma-70 factor (ECF subfamily)
MTEAPDRLLRDARRGDEAAFLRLFDAHHLPLFRFAWRLTGSAADAEDIVQDCLLALLRPGCSFDPARTPIRTYLFGAVRNQSLKRMRARNQTTAPQTPDNPTPEAEALRDEIAAAVANAIAELPNTQREVVLLAHYEQLALAEIAEITQLEVTAVKSRLQRARAALREALAAFAPRQEKLHE